MEALAEVRIRPVDVRCWYCEEAGEMMVLLPSGLRMIYTQKSSLLFVGSLRLFAHSCKHCHGTCRMT